MQLYVKRNEHAKKFKCLENYRKVFLRLFMLSGIMMLVFIFFPTVSLFQRFFLLDFILHILSCVKVSSSYCRRRGSLHHLNDLCLELIASFGISITLHFLFISMVEQKIWLLFFTGKRALLFIYWIGRVIWIDEILFY